MGALLTARKLGYGIVVIIIFSLWWGVPTYRKWRADRMVDKLCAKDGGSKIYETITLPADKFNKLGWVRVPSKDYIKPTDEFYNIEATTWILPESRTIGGLDIFRSHAKIFRIRDGKLLSEHITYSRRGGDPVGPWHPSSYSCSGKEYFYKQPFIQTFNGGYVK